MSPCGVRATSFPGRPLRCSSSASSGGMTTPEVHGTPTPFRPAGLSRTPCCTLSQHSPFWMPHEGPPQKTQVLHTLEAAPSASCPRCAVRRCAWQAAQHSAALAVWWVPPQTRGSPQYSAFCSPWHDSPARASAWKAGSSLAGPSAALEPQDERWWLRASRLWLTCCWACTTFCSRSCILALAWSSCLRRSCSPPPCCAASAASTLCASS
mmetsp:Transcript_51329/g.164102  ORF Transcript_51329/g.164102 Transcript_51329/m.164102 type:complete len:210 (-) Transcript_51329:345-974(-)